MSSSTDLVTATNRLLASVGLDDRPFRTDSEIQDNASSLLVAIFEAIFSTRVADLRRKPNDHNDYVFNAQRIIDSLRAILPPRVIIPNSVTGDSIANGDLPAITFLVSLLGDVDRVIRKPSSTTKKSNDDNNAENEENTNSTGNSMGSPEQVQAVLAASSLGRSGDDEHDAEIIAIARKAAENMAAVSNINLQTAATSATTTDFNQTGKSDIWSGQSPDKVRAKATKAGLGGGKAVPPVSPSMLQRPAGGATGTTSRTITTTTTTTTTTTKSKTGTTPSGKPTAARLTPAKKNITTTILPPPIPAAEADETNSHDGHEEGTTGGGGGGEGGNTNKPNENMDPNSIFAAEQARRQAAAEKAAARRANGVMSRILNQNKTELQQLTMMTTAAIKSREADFRVMEAKALRAATARAKAAKHERKVMALRTRQTLEDMARNTLGLRIARSSKQAAAAATLLKALSAQERLAAAEKLRMAADEQARTLGSAQGQLAWIQQQAKMVNDLVLEETAKQVSQRQAAARSQREALNRAIRDMRVDENALLARMKAEQEHAEAAFLAQHVEPMNGGAGAIDGVTVSRDRVTDGTDTDIDPQRVYTMQRVANTLGRTETQRNAGISNITNRLNDLADDTDAGYNQANRMMKEAKEVIAIGDEAYRNISQQLGNPAAAVQH